MQVSSGNSGFNLICAQHVNITDEQLDKCHHTIHLMVLVHVYLFKYMIMVEQHEADNHWLYTPKWYAGISLNT